MGGLGGEKERGRGFLWWSGAVGKKGREWTIVGGLGDEKGGGAALGIPVVTWCYCCGWIG